MKAKRKETGRSSSGMNVIRVIDVQEAGQRGNSWELGLNC